MTSRRTEDGGDGFQVRIRRLPGLDYVSVRGDLDMQHVADLRLHLDPATCDQATLLLDLTPMEFIDSTGIAAVVRAHRDAQARGAHLVIACGPKTERILAMVGLAGVLDVHASVDEILAARRLPRPPED